LLILAIAFATSCKQYRIIPVTEAWKLSAENVPPSGGVVVTDVEGQSVRIQGFRLVDVYVPHCSYIRNGQDEFCYTEGIRFIAPLHMELDGDTLAVTPNPRDWRRGEGSRREGPRPRRTWRFTDVRRVAVVDSSSRRTWTIVAPAVVTGLVTCLATTVAVAGVDDDPHGLVAILAGASAGAAVAGGTLLITFPATRDLGEVIE
jgi:hypothetical protein